MNNDDVHGRVLGADIRPLTEVIDIYFVLRMPSYRLPFRSRFSDGGQNWGKAMQRLG